MNAVTSPSSSKTGDRVQSAMNSVPSFRRLVISPFQTRPEDVVFQISS